MILTWFQYFFGEEEEEEEIVPDEQTLRRRHLLMRQIKLSNLKLKPVKTNKRVRFKI